MDIILNIVEDFKQLDSVQAIVLAGSSTSLINDADSDYDIYIYYKNEIDKAIRNEIISKYTNEFIISTGFFEEGDEAKINDINYDFMYRDLSFIPNQINDIWLNHNARLGYTTCFLYNFKNCKILYDKNDYYSKSIACLYDEYPKTLKENIILKNFNIIAGVSLFTYIKQLEVAIKRNDIISINHRVSAIIASYFDIIFAYNEVLHPGEKKLIKYANLLCKNLPLNMEDDLNKILANKNLLKNIKCLIINLQNFIKITD